MAPTPPSQKWRAKNKFLFKRSNVSSAGLGPEFEICQGAPVQVQPGECTRDCPLKGAEIGTGIASDAADAKSNNAASGRVPTEAKGRLKRRGKTGSCNEPPRTISTVAFISKLCRGCCAEGHARRGGSRGSLRSAVSRTHGQRPCHQWQPLLHQVGDQPTPKTRVPRELSEWLQSCHEELGEALVVGNENRVMELSSRLSDGAARLSELMEVMLP